MTRRTEAVSVYIVRCADGSLYTGAARDVVARIALHDAGRGARYTRGRGPVELVYRERCASLGAALKRERAIKQLSRLEKQVLIAARRVRKTRRRSVQ